MKNKKKRREISMAQVTEKVMLSRLHQILPRKETSMKIQMTPKVLVRTSHYSREDSSALIRKIYSRRKDPATLAAPNPHQNQQENTPASSAESQVILFRTALYGKLKSVLLGDMIQEAVAKARARATTPMMKRKRRSSPRRRIPPSPHQDLPRRILPNPRPTARTLHARPRRTSARKWIPKKNHLLTTKRMMNQRRTPTLAWLA